VKHPAARSWGSRGKASTSRKPERLGAEPQALGIFSIKITHFMHAKIVDLKAITHQLKAFKNSRKVLNRINKEQVL